MRSPLAFILVSGLVSGLVAACGGASKAPPGTTPDATPDAPDVSPHLGCDGATLLSDPSDFAAPGPWPVGVRTATIDGLTTEIWYPAVPGSDTGMTTERYDIRLELPASEAAKIPDADNPWQACDCVRGLPLDDSHGPYPIVLFVHGTAAFRFQSLHFMTHWASRGFIVVAADHPGLKLGDILATACGGTSPAQHLSADLDSLIAALAAPAGDLAFLSGHLDTTRVAVTGHSAGAGAAASASTKPGVEVVVSMAGVMPTAASPALQSSLYFGGLSDSIAAWSNVQSAWGSSPTPRRLVGIDKGGHLTFSDLCQTTNAAGQNLLQIAEAHNVCGASLAGFLFDCDPSHIDGPTGWNIVDYASSSVLESVLQCQPPFDLSTLSSTYPAVTQYQQAL